ncbi:MAG: GT4 family glycosyltransferase PelF [Candidatus Ventricola sp.]
MRICVICEGCYPFVAGGVSSWLHGLIRSMPQHEFVIWAIGAQEKQRNHYAYEMPDNVVGMQDVYLDSVLHEHLRPRRRSLHLKKDQRAALCALLRCAEPDWNCLFRLLSRKGTGNVEFLLTREFLEILMEIAAESYPHVAFTDYFWTIRSMFLPLLYLMGGDVPEADLYYSVSAGYAGVLGSMAHLRTGKPFVLTEHGIYTREREEEILRTDWVPAQFKDLWINMFYMFTRCAYRYADRVTSLFYRASLIQQEIGCPPKKCRVIPNGVNYERFSRVPPKQEDGWVDIGAVVRLVPIKDIKTMLYAFSLVCTERSDVRLHIMGPTNEDEEYYEECVRLKEDLGLKNAIFTGRVNVVEYLEKIDFVLLTSLSEGQPLAVLEGMAAGRPAVTTDVGSCRELLEGSRDDFGPAGLCVPVMHQSALAEAMLTLCENADMRRQMGQNGMRRVCAVYQLSTMVERYDALFSEVAGGDGHGGNRV